MPAFPGPRALDSLETDKDHQKSVVILPEVTWILVGCLKVQQPILSGQTCAATAHTKQRAAMNMGQEK